MESNKDIDLDAYLATLPAAKRKKILELIRKKQLAEKENKLASFQPNPGAQASFFQSTARIRGLFGGNALGKTTALIIELLWQHLRVHPIRDCTKTEHTWLIVPSHEKAEDYWTKIKEWCPPSQLPEIDKMGTSHIRRFRWKNGTMTTIFSHEQESNKLEGTNISGLFLDEPCPRAQYVAAFRGLRENPDYFVVIAATPISEPWLYEEIYQPWEKGTDPNIAIFTGNSYENKHIPRQWIDDFAARLTDEEKEVRIRGKFASLQGRVFTPFNRDTHLISSENQWPAGWPVWICIDPHSRKDHTAIYLGMTPDKNYVVIDELKIGGTIKDLAWAIHEKNKKYPGSINGIFIDTKGKEKDWTRNSAVTILQENGIRAVSVGTRVKDIFGGINLIKNLLVGEFSRDEQCIVPRLKIMEHCVNLIHELEMYSWVNSKNPEKTGISERPKKTHDDFIDPLRYLVSMNLSASVGLEEEENIRGFNGIGYNKDYERFR